MPAGFQVFNAGSPVLDIGSRITRLILSQDYTVTGTNWLSVAVSGMTTDGTWAAMCLYGRAVVGGTTLLWNYAAVQVIAGGFRIRNTRASSSPSYTFRVIVLRY